MQYTTKETYNEESFYYKPYGTKRKRTYNPFGNANYEDVVKKIKALFPEPFTEQSLLTKKKPRENDEKTTSPFQEAWKLYQSLAETTSGQGVQDMRQRFALEHPRLFEIINEENFDQYKANVKTQIIEGGLLTDADRIDKILRAYSLLEVLAPAYIELFYQTYPAEAALLTDKLMLFGRYSPKVSLQRGFRDQEMGYKKEVIGKKTKITGVDMRKARDNKAILIGAFLEEIKKPAAAQTRYLQLVDLHLEAGIEMEVRTMVKEDESLPPAFKQRILDDLIGAEVFGYNFDYEPDSIYYTAKATDLRKLRRDKEAYNTLQLLADVLNANRNTEDPQAQLGTIHLLMGILVGSGYKAFIPKLFDQMQVKMHPEHQTVVDYYLQQDAAPESQKPDGRVKILGVIGDLIRRKGNTQRISTAKAQYKFGSDDSFYGFDIDYEDSPLTDNDAYQAWYQKNVEENSEIDTNLLKEKNGKSKKIKPLTSGDVTLYSDFKKAKRGTPAGEDKNELAIQMAVLPIQGMNFFMDSLAFRSDQGHLKHGFVQLKWDALERGKAYRQAKREGKYIKGDMWMLFEELEFTNMHIKMWDETYAIGRLRLQDVKLHTKQNLGTVKELRGLAKFGMDRMMPLLMNLYPVVMNALFMLMARFTYEKEKQEEFQKVVEEFNTAFANEPLQELDLELNVGNLLVENFFGTSLGHIGKIALKKQKPKKVVEEEKEKKKEEEKGKKEAPARTQEALTLKLKVDKAAVAQKERLALAKELKELGKVRDKRDNHADIAEHTKKVREAQDNIQEVEGTRKITNLSLDTGSIELADAALLTEMASSMLLDGFLSAGLSLENPQGLDDLHFPEGLLLTNDRLSGNAISGLYLDVPNITVPYLSADRLVYASKEEVEGGTLKDTLLTEAEGVVFEKLQLGVEVDFADFEPQATGSDNTKEEKSMFNRLKITNLTADTAKFDSFLLQMPRPDNGGFYPMMRITQPMQINSFKLDFEMKGDQMNVGLEIGKLFQQQLTPDKANLRFEYYGKDKEGGQQDVTGKAQVDYLEGIKYSMKGSDQVIELAGLGINTLKLDQLHILSEGLEIKSDYQCVANQIDLKDLTLSLNLEKEIIKVDFLKRFFVNDFQFNDASTGKIVYNGTEIPLKNVVLKALLAENMVLDLSTERDVNGDPVSKSIFEQFKQGKVSAEHFDLSSIVIKSLLNLDHFEATSFYLERYDDEKDDTKYEILEFGAALDGQVSKRTATKKGTEETSLALTTTATGKYYQEKDSDNPIIESKLTNTTFSALSKNTARKDPIEASLSADHLGFVYKPKEGLLTLDLGEAISLNELHYKQDDDHYITRHATKKGSGKPIQLIRPKATLKLLYKETGKEGERKVIGYNLVNLHFDKIAASNLEVKYGAIQVTLPHDKEASISDVNLSGLYYTESNLLNITLNTGKLSLEELRVNLNDTVKLNPYLDIAGLKFVKTFDGDTHTTLEGIELGLLTKPAGKYYDPEGALIETPKEGEKATDHIYLEPYHKAANAPILKSGKLVFKTKGEEMEAILSDPELGAIVVRGHYQRIVSQGDQVMSGTVVLNHLILSGQLEGDLVYKDTPQKTTLSSANDMEIQIEEASLQVSDLSNFLSTFSGGTSTDKEKTTTEAAPTTTDNTAEEEMTIDSYWRDILKAYLKKQKEREEEIEETIASYQFLNMFGGSNVSVKLFQRSIFLNVEERDLTFTKATYINLEKFLRDFSGVLIEVLAALSPLDDWKEKLGEKALESLSDELISSGGTVIHEVLEEMYGKSFVSQNSVSLPLFAFLLQDLVQNAAPEFVQRLLDKVIHTPFDWWEDDIKKSIKDAIFSEGEEDPNADPDQLIPEIVEELLAAADPELVIKAKAQSANMGYTSRGLLTPFTQSDLTNGEFSLSSTISLKFDREKVRKKVPGREANTLDRILFESRRNRENPERLFQLETFNQKGSEWKRFQEEMRKSKYVEEVQLNPRLTIRDTHFDGFSKELSFAAGDAKLHTRSMGVKLLEVRKESLRKSGKVDVKAKDIFIKGFKLEIDKPKKKEKK